MSSIDQDQLTVEIARRFITEAAPKELRIFEEISEEFLEDPDRIIKQRAGKDEPLGFGVAETVILLTPIALTVANAVLTAVVEKTTESVWTRIGNAIRKLLKRKKTPQKVTLTSLTPEQLVMVREQAFQKARSLKIPEPQAKLLAESIVGGLATAIVDNGDGRH